MEKLLEPKTTAQKTAEKSPFERMMEGRWTYEAARERVRTNPVVPNLNAEYYLRRDRDALAKLARGQFRVV